MPRHCRLCKTSVAADSMFCQQHRSQAAVFASAFGKRRPVTDSPVVRRSEAGKQRAKRARVITQSIVDRGKEEVLEPKTEREKLYSVLQYTLDLVLDRALEQTDHDKLRWPQISVYYLHGRLQSRAYYSMIPKPNGVDFDGASYEMRDIEMQTILSASSDIFTEFADRLADRSERLRDRSLQTLDMHFVTYAGLIAINEHFPSQNENNLATFELSDGDFVRVDAASVADRMRHDRW